MIHGEGDDLRLRAGLRHGTPEGHRRRAGRRRHETGRPFASLLWTSGMTRVFAGAVQVCRRDGRCHLQHCRLRSAGRRHWRDGQTSGEEAVACAVFQFCSDGAARAVSSNHSGVRQTAAGVLRRPEAMKGGMNGCQVRACRSGRALFRSRHVAGFREVTRRNSRLKLDLV